jgi:hypothetical protein
MDDLYGELTGLFTQFIKIQVYYSIFWQNDGKNSSHWLMKTPNWFGSKRQRTDDEISGYWSKLTQDEQVNCW